MEKLSYWKVITPCMDNPGVKEALTGEALFFKDKPAAERQAKRLNEVFEFPESAAHAKGTFSFKERFRHADGKIDDSEAAFVLGIETEGQAEPVAETSEMQDHVNLPK